MSKREDFISTIENHKLVCIFRPKYKDINVVVKAAFTCIDAGAKIIEITYDHTGYKQNSFDIVKKIKAECGDKAFVGFGTVLTLDEAKECMDCDADFLVSPTFNKEISDFAKEKDIYYMPGVFTANEAVLAVSEGNPIVKLFPAGEVGLDYAKALMKPLAYIKFFGVGKMTPDFYRESLKAGLVGCAISSAINSNAILDKEDYDSIANTVKQFIDIAKEN